MRDEDKGDHGVREATRGAAVRAKTTMRACAATLAHHTTGEHFEKTALRELVVLACGFFEKFGEIFQFVSATATGDGVVEQRTASLLEQCEHGLLRFGARLRAELQRELHTHFGA